MYCSHCGKKTESSGKYCPWCGTELPPPKPTRRIVVRRGGGVSTEVYAGFGRRFAAALIDSIFILFIGIFLTGLLGLSEGARMIYQALRHVPMTDRYGVESGALIPFPVVLMITVLFILLPWLYFSVLECSRNQASLGKMAMRLAVTDRHGRRLTFARATLRHFSKYISLFIFFIGFIAIGFTRCRQGFHDFTAGTYVFLQTE